jgi:transcriptional regulator with XRE-family HTH domain
MAECAQFALKRGRRFYFAWHLFRGEVIFKLADVSFGRSDDKLTQTHEFQYRLFREQNKMSCNDANIECRLAMLEEPGRKLRQVRERLRLKYRDVEEASQRIAGRHGNDEFLIGLSRLADIENKGTIPSIYRLYSLCTIYGLNFTTALEWYGVDLDRLPADAAGIRLMQTRPVDFREPNLPATAAETSPDPAFTPLELTGTTYLTRQAQRSAKLPAALLDALDFRRQRYAFIGTEDWTMFPIIPPGSLVQIDDSKRRISNDEWTHEHERPIYFLEHRTGYRCAWCTEKHGLLIVQPHPLSHAQIDVLRYPGEADIVGQVVGVVMRLDPARRRRKRS